MSVQRICDVCHYIKQNVDGTTSVKRYSLRREEGKRFEKTRQQISAGGIDMCDECWEKIGLPRTNPNKRRAAQTRWTKP
jgi:hypothetical protein